MPMGPGGLGSEIADEDENIASSETPINSSGGALTTTKKRGQYGFPTRHVRRTEQRYISSTLGEFTICTPRTRCSRRLTISSLYSFTTLTPPNTGQTRT